ncbi:MAG: LPS export ABC transporter periplasmic protein LptC [Gammaproteobacteria bacterium]|nr:MAG: LPS export ABC transporter periplasmic protein LptC [Gammaproteobacteria bacterium]
MIAQQARSVFLLLLIFVISMWAVNYFPEQKTATKPVASERSATYFAVGYSKTQMDQNGLTNSKLTADYAESFSGNIGTRLKKPVMTVYKEETPPWVIRSETGHISPGGNQISMNGQVFIDRAAAENAREVKIKTSNLRVQPNRNYAETDDWAEMVSGLDRISGVGMKLFYQDPLYIKLLANIKGRHEYN